MKIIIAGASGFIGRKLIEVLVEGEYTIIALSRDPEEAYKVLPANVSVIGYGAIELKNAIGSSDVVINLAGDSIASGKWTDKKKTAMMNSRLHTARRLMDAVKSSKNNKLTFIQASAIGYYGNVVNESCIEESPRGAGFLAEICSRWESHIPELRKHTQRAIIVRIGLVLGNGGGMLAELLRLSKRRMAGKLGTGKQWLSWIHIYDLIHAIIYLMNDEKTHGTYNLVAPEPLQQKEFIKTLARISDRKLQLNAPAFMIRAMMGEMGEELLLSGQKVSSAKIVRGGFMFKFEKLDQALNDLIL